MANELIHGTVGTALTQAEYESVTGHSLDSQARGDMIISNTAGTGLIRLAKGTEGQILKIGANDAAWAALPAEVIPFLAGDFANPTTNPAVAGTEGDAEGEIATLDFDNATEEFADGVLVVPAGYVDGNITVTYYWIPAASSSAADTVAWTFAGVVLANDLAAATAVADLIATTSDVVLLAQDMHIISGVWSAGLPTAGDLLKFRVSRDVGGTDDMVEDAKLVGISVSFPVEA